MSREKIIVALDVDQVATAEEIVSELGGEISTFKIGLQLFTAAGADFVRKLVEKDLKIFLDLKFHDIPNTVAKASVEAARLGVWMFNVHTLGGGEMMRQTALEVGEFCDRKNIFKPKIIGVTILTSSNSETLREVGINQPVAQQVLDLAQLAQKNGLDGVVASPLETAAIKELISQDFLLVTPGVRPAQAADDDQKRVMTPQQAIVAGSDYLVIGRPITRAANRREAVNSIITEIEQHDRIL